MTLPGADPIGLSAAAVGSNAPKSGFDADPLSTRFLDPLRGLASVFVLLHHGLLWLHPGYREGFERHPEQYGFVKHLLFKFCYPFRFGHVAVIFFFVLSGFVIHLSYAKKFQASTAVRLRDYPRFMWRRIKRLYPPVLLALTLTYGIDRLGMALGYLVYRADTPYILINHTVGIDHRPVTLVGNLAFLMNTYVPLWGTDSPLWSLKYEWWFYVVYPLCWPFLRRSTAMVTLAVLAMGGLSYYPAVWPLRLFGEVFAAFPMWWLGVLLAEIYVRRIRVSFRGLAIFVVLLPVCFGLAAVNFAVHDWIWAFGFFGLIASGFALQEAGFTLTTLNRLKWLGDCSYTLYVIHAPLLILFAGWLMSRSPTGELPSSFLPAFLSLLVVPLAYTLHFVVERPRKTSSRRTLSIAGPHTTILGTTSHPPPLPAGGSPK